MTNSRSRVRLHALAAALLLLFAAGTLCFAEGGSAVGAPALRDLVRPGERAPAFALDDLDGRTVSVGPGGETPTLVVFFSVFCPLCRESAPLLAETAARAEGKVRVVGVDLDGKRFAGAVRSFVAANGFRFPVLLDEIRDDLFVAADRFGVSKTPTAVLVDGSGVVRGAFAAEKVRDLLRDFDRVVAGAPER